MRAAETVQPVWPTATLDKVCELQNGFAFDGSRFSRTHGVPLIRIRDLKTNSPSERFDGEFDPALLVKAGDLLVGMDGEFRCYRWTGPEALLNQRVCRLLPRADVLDPEYLGLALDRHLKEIEDATSFTTVKHISSRQILAIRLPLPPVAEQRRVAARLTAQLAAVERARQAAVARLDASAGLSQAISRAAFSPDVTTEWPAKPLGDAGQIVSGVALGRQFRGRPTRVVPYLRVANVKDGLLDLSEVKETEATEEEIAELTLRRGDLLLTEGGDPDKLGRGGLWTGQLPLCIHQNHIFRVRLNRQEYLPQFVSLQVGSPYGKAYFLKHAKRTTGIATINRTVLGAFPLLSPPLSTQRAVVESVRKAVESARRTVDETGSELAAIKALPATLLREAFAA